MVYYIIIYGYKVLMNGYIVWLNEDGILGRLGHKFIEVFSSHTRYGFSAVTLDMDSISNLLY